MEINNPLPPVAYSDIYHIAGFILLILALALFTIVIILFKVRPSSLLLSIKNRYLQATAKMRIKDIYNRKLNDLAKRYKAGGMSDDECFLELSIILREFATKKAELENDSSKLTLRDIKKIDKNDTGWKQFTDAFLKLYGSQFAFSRDIYTPDMSINSARVLVNRWK
ncbi:MAG: hypothetical protein LBB07_00995 [Bifidobacteriaceae bacterium]|jgi:hypothetical protein|nr:hypothetical protein [Bifidobacteriaceae bacterium]